MIDQRAESPPSHQQERQARPTRVKAPGRPKTYIPSNAASIDHTATRHPP